MFFLVSLNFDIDKMSLIRCSIDCYCENNASRIEKKSSIDRIYYSLNEIRFFQF